MKKFIAVLMFIPLVCFGDSVDEFCEALSTTGELSVKARIAGHGPEHIMEIVKKSSLNQKAIGLVEVVVYGAYEKEETDPKIYKNVVLESCKKVFKQQISCKNCKQI